MTSHKFIGGPLNGNTEQADSPLFPTKVKQLDVHGRPIIEAAKAPGTLTLEIPFNHHTFAWALERRQLRVIEEPVPPPSLPGVIARYRNVAVGDWAKHRREVVFEWRYVSP
jgi:hypothetical protein